MRIKFNDTAEGINHIQIREINDVMIFDYFVTDAEKDTDKIRVMHGFLMDCEEMHQGKEPTKAEIKYVEQNIFAGYLYLTFEYVDTTDYGKSSSRKTGCYHECPIEPEEVDQLLINGYLDATKAIVKFKEDITFWRNQWKLNKSRKTA